MTSSRSSEQHATLVPTTQRADLPAINVIAKLDCPEKPQELQRRDYRTIEARDGREALEVYRQFAHEISLVLLDLTMPYMNGEEVLRELKAITPSVKVLLSSRLQRSRGSPAVYR